MRRIACFFIFVFICCSNPSVPKGATKTNHNPKPIKVVDTLQYTDGFDFPVGPPDAKGYYNAQAFGENYHLGEDWNGRGGANTDLGDTIYVVANGYVKEVKDYRGGWGNVMQVVHYRKNTFPVVSLYAHCDTILVVKGNYLRKGTPIATIGTADGAYLAHLHFEMRKDTSLLLGPGYAIDSTGYINPTQFLIENR